MEIHYRVLTPQEADHVRRFENGRLEKNQTEEFIRQMKSWSAPWREESLNHYLPYGWCFGAWTGKGEAETMAGYFIAQPILFFRNQTQTLWVESLGGRDESVTEALVELAIKYARDKHLQAVLFAVTDDLRPHLEKRKGQFLGKDIYEIRTTRAQG